MCFKEFVEKVRGLRFLEVVRERLLYRTLLDEFNRKKQVFLDAEETEQRRLVKELAVDE